MSYELNPIARQVFAAAIVEDRCGELLMCLFEGGSCTVDASTGKLVLADADQLAALTENGRRVP